MLAVLTITDHFARLAANAHSDCVVKVFPHVVSLCKLAGTLLGKDNTASLIVVYCPYLGSTVASLIFVSLIFVSLIIGVLNYCENSNFPKNRARRTKQG